MLRRLKSYVARGIAVGNHIRLPESRTSKHHVALYLKEGELGNCSAQLGLKILQHSLYGCPLVDGTSNIYDESRGVNIGDPSTVKLHLALPKFEIALIRDKEIQYYLTDLMANQVFQRFLTHIAML
jgi:hypothetical protein